MEGHGKIWKLGLHDYLAFTYNKHLLIDVFDLIYCEVTSKGIIIILYVIDLVK